MVSPRAPRGTPRRADEAGGAIPVVTGRLSGLGVRPGLGVRRPRARRGRGRLSARAGAGEGRASSLLRGRAAPSVPGAGCPAHCSGGAALSRQVALDALVRAAGLVAPIAGDAAAVVGGITYDVDQVVSGREAGPLHCCLVGRRVDGHDLASDAVARGAAALLVERRLDLPVPQVLVAPGAARPAMARLAAAYFGEPAKSLATVGVTGTNGKTTTVAMVHAILETAGLATLVVGTLTGARTTPEAPDLQALLAGHVSKGGRAAALEVSSHALVAQRVEGIRFDVCVFTNLSPEHLDFHGDMERYFRAKASLFEPKRAGLAVVNVDDRWGARLAGELGSRAQGPRVDGFGLGEVDDLELGRSSSTFRWRGATVTLRLPGRHNVANALGAAHAAAALGIDVGSIAAGLGTLAGVPGRLEPVDAGQDFTVWVDYAHTPDALAVALRAARAATVPGGRVVVVFGCGGERDRQKRPAMGALAAELADLAVLTSDNPRSEDPLAIIAEVEAGAHDRGRLVVEPDRARAIAAALAAAGPGDVVLVAGKGHETGQDLGREIVPFDDRVVARELLRNREGDATGGGA